MFWDPPNPFRHRRPLTDVSEIVGGCPDERTAEEMIADIRAVKYEMARGVVARYEEDEKFRRGE
jgi:hypothetical protein